MIAFLEAVFVLLCVSVVLFVGAELVEALAREAMKRRDE